MYNIIMALLQLQNCWSPYLNQVHLESFLLPVSLLFLHTPFCFDWKEKYSNMNWLQCVLFYCSIVELGIILINFKVLSVIINLMT